MVLLEGLKEMNDPSVVPEVVEQIMRNVYAVHGFVRPIFVPIAVAMIFWLLYDWFSGEQKLLSESKRLPSDRRK